MTDATKNEEEAKETRRAAIKTVLRGIAGTALVVTAALVAAPHEANACRCGQGCCSGSPVVQ